MGAQKPISSRGRSIFLVLAMGVALWTSQVEGVGAGLPPDVAARKGQAILGRMQARFNGLETFTARLDARVKLSLLPGVGVSGKVYYKRPDKVKVELDSLPHWVQRFEKSFSGLAPTQRDKAEYVATYEGDEVLRGCPCYRLVVLPKDPKRSNVREIRMWVDQKDCTVPRATVSYNDGSTVTSDTTFKPVHGYLLPATQQARLSTSHANAEVSATFSDYAINQRLPDGVFPKRKT